MIKDITIGQYVRGNSILHRMDARIKIILIICYIVVLFMISNPISYVLFGIGVIMLVFISKINLRFFYRGIKPMLFIIIFTTIINLIMTPGNAIFQIPFFKWHLSLTYEGVKAGLTMFFRLLFLIIGTSILTLTTTPLKLTDGIENLLNPLKKIKVPAHEIAMMMTIAIRFIPTLADELDKIQKAQMARGADFSSKNIIKRAKAMIPLLIPLFVSAFKRADDLATAMDARCYNCGNNRTKLHQSKITKTDIYSCIIFFTFSVVLVLIQNTIEF